MTALDKAFIKAYGRPRRGLAAKTASRPAPQPSVSFERGSTTHRIDAPVEAGQGDEFEPIESVVAIASPYAASLPTVEELDSHATRIVAVVEPARSKATSQAGSVEAAVAATAADLRAAWPERFSSDAPALLDEQSDAPAASAARPLSAFAPAPLVAEPLRPLLEVDRFQWSSQCHALCSSSHAALDGFVSHLLSGAAEGQHRVALIGMHSMVGRATVAMSLVRRAAAQGANWVLVDAEFAQPELALRLGIVAELGWSRVLSGQQQLGEVMIASIEDRFAIVPLESGSLTAEQLPANFRTSVLFDMLAEAYELVLIDAGSPGRDGVKSLAACNQAAHWDAAYLVYDGRSSDFSDVVAYARQLTTAGVPVAGAIENFAARSGDLATRSLA